MSSLQQLALVLDWWHTPGQLSGELGAKAGKTSCSCADIGWSANLQEIATDTGTVVAEPKAGMLAIQRESNQT